MKKIKVLYLALFASSIVSQYANAECLTDNCDNKKMDKSDFLGMYQTSNSETLSELYVLDDNTFCFTFMGGSLDLLTAGTWEESKKNKNKILFKETIKENNIHPARALKLNRLDNKISITINGYNLDKINTPVFALSQEKNIPTAFKPLLPQNNSTGRATYAFPLLSPEEAKYFYLGNIESNDIDNVDQLKVTQYEIGSNDTFQIDYLPQTSDFPKDFNAELIDGEIFINGELPNKKADLVPQMVEAVKEQCINPMMEQEDQNESNSWITLKPSNIYYLDKKLITNEPYFSKDDDDQARRLNGVTELIEDEKKILEAAYDKALKDFTAYSDLFSIAKELLQKEDRKNIYISDISLKLTQLLVKTMVRGDIKSAKEQFNAYIINIHPFIKDSTDRQVKYSELVVASQGAIIYAVTRDEAVLTAIHDTLLGKEFDIETTNNPTLVYNLACVYALTKNKPEMLKAIIAARKMKKTSQQFLKDSDFSFYLNDNDFLNAIK